MIDLYSGDKTCILSRLDLNCNLVMKHNLHVILIFDQPLYGKAAELIIDAPQNSHLKDNVLLLGCFHTLMNELSLHNRETHGGDKFEKLLETEYGKNACRTHDVRKAVQRGLPGHLLVDKCLHDILVSEMVDVLLDKAEEVYLSILSVEIASENVLSSVTFTKLEEAMEENSTELRNKSKISQLWLEYQRVVGIAQGIG